MRATVRNAPYGAYAPGLFAGEVAVVSGAAGGVGRETARAFYALGAHVVLQDSNEVGLREIADELGANAECGQIMVAPCDVTDAAAVERFYAAVDDRFERVDHLVTCAAVITARRSMDHDTAHWRRVLDINLVGTYDMLRGALQRMLAQESGNIVAIASDAGKRGGGGLVADAAYAASKAGVLSVVKSMAREFSGRGVRINALVPGPTDTPMHAGLPQDLRDRIGRGLPLGRMGDPEEMAAGIVFLCSPAATFVYGCSLNVDGGAMFE